MRRVIAIMLLISISLIGCGKASTDEDRISELEKQVEELQSQLSEQSENQNMYAESIEEETTIPQSTEELSEAEEFLSRLEIDALPSRITLERLGELLRYEVESFELTTEDKHFVGDFVELHYEIKAKSLNELKGQVKIGDSVMLPAACYDANGILVESFWFNIMEAGYGKTSKDGAYIMLPKDTVMLSFDVEGEGDTVPGTGTGKNMISAKESQDDMDSSVEGMEQIIDNNVAIRSAASYDAEIVFSGTEGDVVEVVQDCDNEYTKIFYRDTYCYIQDRFITNSAFESQDDFVCPTSYRTYLTETDINRLTKEEIRIALNEIYARRGRIFKNEEMKEYFSSKSWYRPQFLPEEFDNNTLYYLNCYELDNISLLSKYANQ